MRGGLRNRFDHPAEHPDHGGGLHAEVAGTCPRFERRHEIGEPVGVEAQTDQFLESQIIEFERGALQAIRDDLLPDRRLALLAFAQHLGVVDLPQLHVAAGEGGPGAGDAPFAANRFCRPRQQQEERPPGVAVTARMHRELADEMRVKQRGELADRRVGPEKRTIVEQQVVGKDGQPHRAHEAAR